MRSRASSVKPGSNSRLEPHRAYFFQPYIIESGNFMLSQVPPKTSKSCEWLTASRLKTFLKVCGYVLILVGCLYQSGTFLGLYLEYPATVEFNVENKAVLDFPAITVCNSNPVRYKLWCQENGELCKRKPNETFEALQDRQALEYDLLSKKKRIELGTQLKDFVMYAQYEQEDVTNSFTRYYDYEFTNCYTFNSLWGHPDQPLKSAIVYNPVTGLSSELLACFNVDVDNYSNQTDSVVGRMQMTIHENDIVPNPTYDSSSLEAGEFYSYGVQKVTTELLESPYQTRCKNYTKIKEERTGARMSQKNCLLECFKNQTENICGCTYRRLSLMYGGIPCLSGSQSQCLDTFEVEVFRTCNPQCPIACRKTEFSFITTDSEPLRNESAMYQKMNVDTFFRSREEMNRNMVCLRIHYGSTETRTLSYRPKYVLIELFSLLGGYTGLWLGFSLTHCYEFLLLAFTDFTRRRMNLRNKDKVKKIKRRKRYY